MLGKRSIEFRCRADDVFLPVHVARRHLADVEQSTDLQNDVLDDSALFINVSGRQGEERAVIVVADEVVVAVVSWLDVVIAVVARKAAGGGVVSTVDSAVTLTSMVAGQCGIVVV